MIRRAIAMAVNKENLSRELAESVMDEIMSGRVSEIQMSAYLTALAAKGETIDEITASAAAMRRHCVRLLHEMDVLEIVGTGGDHSNSFNISTTCAIVVSASGVPVAKHGNRAASSKCGAADVLEALGVNINVSPETSKRLLEKIGLCFLFAQNYHISMKYVAPVRRELGIRTIFNILGPLCNPAGANMELLGVNDPSLVEPLAKVLHNLGVKRAMVVCGKDGLDEISLSAPTKACQIKDGSLSVLEIEPERFGLSRCRKEDLTGGDPSQNAMITRSILTGEKGPKRDAVLLNSAAALLVAGAVPSIRDGIDLAAETIDSKKAIAQLTAFIKLSNEPQNKEAEVRP